MIEANKKYEIIQIADEIGVDKASKLFNVSKVTIYSWIKAFKKYGKKGLDKKKRKSINYPNKISDEITEKIISLKVNNPKLTAESIKKKLNLKYSTVSISSKIRNYNKENTIPFKNNDYNNKPFKKFYISIKKIKKDKELDFSAVIPDSLIIIEDIATGLFYYGFTNDKCDLFIGVFIDYFISTLRKLEIDLTGTAFYINAVYADMKKSHLKSVIEKKHNLKLFREKKYSHSISKLLYDFKRVKKQNIFFKLYKNKNILNTNDFLTVFFMVSIIHNYNILKAYLIKNNISDEKIITFLKKDLLSVVLKFNPVLIDSYLSYITDKKSKKEILIALDTTKENKNILKKVINVSILLLEKSEKEIGFNSEILWEILGFSDNIKIKIILLSAIVNNKIKSKDLIITEKYIKEGIILSKKENDLSSLANFYDFYSEILYMKADYSKSLIYVEKSYEFAKSQNDNYKIIDYLNRKVIMYYLTGKKDKALSINNDLEIITGSIKKKSVKIQEIILATKMTIATIYAKERNFSIAISLFQECYKLALKIKVFHISNSALNNIGSIKFQQNNYEEAKKYCNKALKNFTENSDDFSICVTLISITLIYIKEEQFEKALLYSKRSLDIAIKMKSINNIIVNYNNIGNIYDKLKEYKAAFTYINKAINLNRDELDLASLGLSLKNKASILYHKKNYKSALNCCLKGKKICDRLGDLDLKDMIISLENKCLQAIKAKP